MSILTWADGYGRVANDHLMFDLHEKPKLSFYYVALFYDELSQMYLKILDNQEHRALTTPERIEIKNTINHLIENADYPVYTFDDEGIFRHKVLKSDVSKLPDPIAGYTMIEPISGAAKWDGEKWEQIVAVIMDNGTLRLDPDSVCQLCMLAFTQEEWDEFGKYPNTIYETWNFVAEEWQDQRELSYVKAEAKQLISRVLEGTRQNAVGPYFVEQTTWAKQSDEANAWLADNKAPTPFIDTILGKATTREKEEFCLDVKSRSDKIWNILAQVQAHQVWAYAQVNACTSVTDVDDFVFHLSDTDYDKLFIGE